MPAKYRKGRRTAIRRASAKQITRVVSKLKAKGRVRAQAGRIRKVYNKVHNKVPFKYQFGQHSHHHHKHHTKENPSIDLTTVLVNKNEFKWCCKMAKLVIMARHEGARISKYEYVSEFKHLVSTFIYEKHYRQYLLQENRKAMEEGGLLKKVKHESHLEREEHREEAIEKKDLAEGIQETMGSLTYGMFP